MAKSKSAIFVILMFLFIGFAVISLLSYINKKHPKLISRKIKIGAMILTLSTVMTTNSFSQSCYKVAAEPEKKASSAAKKADSKPLSTDEKDASAGKGDVLEIVRAKVEGAETSGTGASAEDRAEFESAIDWP